MVEGGVTKEHAGCMRAGEQVREALTLSSRHSSVYSVQIDYVCVFHQLTYPGYRSVPVDQAKSLTLTAHSSSSTFPHSLSLSLTCALFPLHSLSHYPQLSQQCMQLLVSPAPFNSWHNIWLFNYNYNMLCTSMYSALCRVLILPHNATI